MTQSPSFLPPPPKSGPGVRRLNRLPIYVCAGATCAVVGVMTYTIYMRGQHNAAAALAAANAKIVAGRAVPLDNAPENGLIPASLSSRPARPLVPPSAPMVPTSPSHTDLSAPTVGPGPQDAATQARQKAWEAYYAALADLHKKRHDAAVEGMGADIGALSNASAGSVQLQTAPPGAVAGAEVGGYPPGFGGAPILPDATGAREKQAFLAQRGSDGTNDTVLALPRDPISPYVVTEGDIIPAIMQGGADSDTPGTITGRVASDVCDSATGSYLLIPAHSKIVGNYDSVVSAGQSRLPAVITRIIFPDSSSIAIGAMPATDQGGYAGQQDEVNRHLWEKFGNSLLVGIAAAGIQISQPQSRGNNGYDSQQLIAGGIGQQFGQLGQEIARSGLAIPNTIRIRPGYRFGVKLTKDVVLRPYIDSRTQEQPASNCRPAPGAQPIQRVHAGPFIQ